MWQQISQAVRGGQHTSPKTILGFLAGVYLIAMSFAFAVIAAVLSAGEALWVLIPVLIFVGLGTVALVGAVFYFARQDPTPLVVGQMTGREFIEHHRLTQGDSIRGERLLGPETEGAIPGDFVEEEPDASAGPKELGHGG